MELAMIGLGRMGGNMATRLADAGHRVLAFDMNQNAADSLAGEHEGITAFRDLTDIVNAMKAPRVIWVMVPHQVVDQVIADLMAAGLQKGDVIVDGGNSSYKDSQRRGEALKDSGIMFVDCGTSGGIWGLSEGYSMMVGGSDQAISIIEPALKSLAPAEDRGWGQSARWVPAISSRWFITASSTA